MTLTPALCALLLRSTVGTRQRFLARAWNASFARLTNGYDWTVRHIVRRAALALAVLLVLSGAAYALLRGVPTGFAPTDAQGHSLVARPLPQPATTEPTGA